MLETECKSVLYQEPENALIYGSEKSLQLLILLDSLLRLLRLKFVANKIIRTCLFHLRLLFSFI
jgi:hypothetical protein